MRARPFWGKAEGRGLYHPVNAQTAGAAPARRDKEKERSILCKDEPHLLKFEFLSSSYQSNRWDSLFNSFTRDLSGKLRAIIHRLLCFILRPSDVPQLQYLFLDRRPWDAERPLARIHVPLHRSSQVSRLARSPPDCLSPLNTRLLGPPTGNDPYLQLLSSVFIFALPLSLLHRF